jgi:hypothetical protein
MEYKANRKSILALSFEILALSQISLWAVYVVKDQ